MPTGLKLSKAKAVPWREQFSDVIRIEELQGTKARFPIPLGFDDYGKLIVQSLFDIGNLINGLSIIG